MSIVGWAARSSLGIVRVKEVTPKPRMWGDDADCVTEVRWSDEGLPLPRRTLERCRAEGSFRVNRLVFLKNTKLLSLGVRRSYLYKRAKGHISPCYRTTGVSTVIQVQQPVVIES